MSMVFDIANYLSGDEAKNAAAITAILKDVRGVLNMNPRLSQSVPFRVTAKGQKGIDDYCTLLHYRGPEAETVEALQASHETWLSDPHRFWHGEPSPDFHSLGPQAEIRCACILFAEYRSRHGEVPAQTIATTIYESRLLEVDPAYVQRTIDKMLSLGSYYRNLESALGAGASLALGTEIAETTWTRVLTKAGPKFDKAIAHLLTTSLPDLARKYSDLRIQLVNYQLQRLTRPISYAQPYGARTMPTQCEAEEPVDFMLDSFDTGYHDGFIL